MFWNKLAQITQYIGVSIEYVGLVFIILAVGIALYELLLKRFDLGKVSKKLGRRLIFSLEIIIAADILLATVATHLSEIIRLGGIVLIRVALGYGLRHEVLDKETK